MLKAGCCRIGKFRRHRISDGICLRTRRVSAAPIAEVRCSTSCSSYRPPVIVHVAPRLAPGTYESVQVIYCICRVSQHHRVAAVTARPPACERSSAAVHLGDARVARAIVRVAVLDAARHAEGVAIVPTRVRCDHACVVPSAEVTSASVRSAVLRIREAPG